MRFISIASSSKGNALLVDNGHSAWLVDCGVPKRRIEQALQTLPDVIERLVGILITHEHSDHIKGLGPFWRRYRLPIYASNGTLSAIQDGRLGKVPPDAFCPFPQTGLKDGEWRIEPLPLSHDANEPTGYRLESGGVSLALATDTGAVDDQLLNGLAETDLLYIEANYDPHLLRTGIYPEALKRRIRGQEGHLSNKACGQVLAKVLSRRTQHVILGHLSEENNRPALAYKTIMTELSHLGGSPEQMQLHVAAPLAKMEINIEAKNEPTFVKEETDESSL